MLNLVELERRWLRYKIKSYIPHAVIVLSLIIIVLLISFFTHSKTPTIKNHVKPQIIERQPVKKQLIEKKVPSPVSKQHTAIHETTHVVTQENEIHREKTLHPKVQLSPSLDFMKKMQNSVQPYYRNEKKAVTPHASAKVKKAPIKKKIEKKEEPVFKTTVRKNSINIQRKNTQNDIYEIIQRFKKNNNPALSLFVAKKYYELGDYKQSYNYALITNKLNSNIESSWIIFAKSLVKLGDKNKAVKTLKKYINYSHSSSAQILLNNILSGKFQ